MINPSLMINGVEIANPNYNPKTKEGRLQPPSFVENDIRKIPEDNPIIKKAITEAAKHEGSILNVDWSKYEKYGIHHTRVNTEEELNKERAQNQSALEQTGHSLGQLVENEIALGTLLGFSNIFDVAHALIKDGEYVGQYANPLTQYLEEAQERNKERLAIYRENPNKSLDFGDFAWWADNFVNVGSTASLLLSSVSITRGLSMLGKGMKFALTGGKLAYNSSGTFRLVGNIAKKFNATQSTLNKLGHNVRNFENVVGYTVPAVFSRTMENYQEAQEVYKDAYDNALVKINSLTNKELAELKLKNEQYANMTNEEIASDIAGMSAQNTFWNDYALLLMDVVQMRGINKFWRGIPNSAYSATTREMAGDAIKRLTKEGTKEVNEAIAKRGIAHNLKIGLINAAKHPLNSISALELSEGIEEGYQGIASEKGKEVAKHILDPNYTNRTIESYLTDSSIWEQALWGIIGGIVFQGIGKGIDTGKRKYKAIKNKDKMTQDQYNRAKMSLEELRQANIQSWNTNTEVFYDNMRKINNGKNPFKIKKDASGKPIQKEDGGYEYEGFESEEEKLKLKQEVLDKYLLDLYQSAADVGNGELLSEFIHSNEIEQGMQEAGVKFDKIDTSIKDFINSRYDYVTNAYERAIYDIYGNVDVQNDYAAKMLAKYVANISLQESYLERDINEQKQIINNLLKNLDYKNFEDIIYDMMNLSTKVNKELQEIDEELEDIEKKYSNDEISKEAYNARKNEINNTRIQLINDFNNVLINSGYNKIDKESNPISQFYEDYKQAFKEYSKSYDETNLKTFLSKFNEFSRQLFNHSINLDRFNININENLTNAINHKNKLLIQKSIITSKKPQFKKDFQEQYDDFDRSLTDNINNQIKNSLDIINGYINDAENEDDLNKRINTILHNAESLGSKFEKAAKILKINGYMIDDESDIMRTLTNMMVSESFKEAVENKREQLKQKEKDKHIVVVDGRERTIPDKTKDEKKIKSILKVTHKKSNEKKPSAKEPSTGREKLDAETIAAEADLKAHLKEIEHISPDYEAISARDRDIYEAKRRSLVNTARDIMIRIRKDNPTLFNTAILSGDINSEEYKKLYDELYERLRAYTSDPKTIKTVIKQVTYSYYKSELIKEAATDSRWHRFKEPAIKIILQVRESPLSNTTDIKLDDVQKKQLFDDFIKGFIEYKNLPIFEKNNKKVIDVNQLFEALLENNKEHPELDFNYMECAQIFEQLIDYIKENDKYEFINTKDFNKYVKNPTLFFNKLKQAKTFRERVITNMRVNGTRHKYDDDTLNKIIRALSNGTKIYVQFNQKKRKDALGYDRYGIKFSIKLDGKLQEVGYTALVEQDTTGDAISLQRLVYEKEDILNNNGFIWENITKEGACSLDDFFESLFLGIEHLNDKNKDYEDNRKLINILYEIHLRNNQLFNIDKDIVLAKKLLENPIVKKILEGNAYERQFGFGGYEKADYEKANQLAKAINSILFFRGEAGLRNAYDSRANYKHFVKTIRKTYEQNYQLQEKLKNHDTIEVQFSGFQDSSVQHDPNESHSLQEYSESSSKLNSKDNPIVIVDEGQLIFEDTNDTAIDLTGASSGAMGIVIRNDKNEPIVSWFTKSRKVVPSTQKDKNNTIRNKIYENLKQELINLLTDYTNKNISLNEFSTAINNLLGGINGHKDGLFGGTSVIVRKSTGELFLKFDDTNTDDKADFYMLAKNTKTGKEEISFTYRDKDGDFIRVTKFTKKNIEEAIDNILKHVIFNQSYYMFNNRTKSSDTENTNPYFTKRDNKMVITLNGETFEFNNFSEFAYKVDAFESDMTIDDKTGGINSLNEIDDENKDRTPPLIINIDNIQLPVEKHDEFDSKTVDDVLSNKEVDTIELIKAYLSSNPNVENIINILFGDNILNLDILPRSIKYDKNDKHGDAKYDKGKIVITKTGKEKLDKNPKDIIRMLFHENLHDKFKERKLKDNEEIIENILDTLRATIESLEKDNSPVAKVLLDWIKENRFDNIEEFHKHHKTNVEQAIKNYINTKKRTETNKDFADYVDKWLEKNGNTEESIQQLIEDRKRKWFAEEWLVECLTRGELIGYLNNTIYIKNGEVVETNIDNSNKSLLQKIIDIFLKILDKINIKNLGNPNKNTIFAYQYSLLKDNISQDLTERKEKPVEEENTHTETESTKQTEAQTGNTDDLINQSNNLLDRLKNSLIKPAIEDKTPANDNTELDEEVPFSSTTDIRLNTRNGLINNNIIGGVNAEHCINVGDMESFVSGFPKSIQPLIAKNIRNGNIKFLC